MPKSKKIVKNPLHKHLLINGKTLTPPKSKRRMRKWLNKIVYDIGMYKIGGPYIKYVKSKGNAGLTAVVMIETSHIALHVWEEGNQPYFRFDLYTCGPLHHKEVIDSVGYFMDSPEMEWTVYDRADGFWQYDFGSWPFRKSSTSKV